MAGNFSCLKHRLLILLYFYSRKLIIRTIFVEYTYQRIPRRRSAFCLMDANLKVKENDGIILNGIRLWTEIRNILEAICFTHIAEENGDGKGSNGNKSTRT